jgi:hypothetical protein
MEPLRVHFSWPHKCMVFVHAELDIFGVPFEKFLRYSHALGGVNHIIIPLQERNIVELSIGIFSSLLQDSNLIATWFSRVMANSLPYGGHHFHILNVD